MCYSEKTKARRETNSRRVGLGGKVILENPRSKGAFPAELKGVFFKNMVGELGTKLFFLVLECEDQKVNLIFRKESILAVLFGNKLMAVAKAHWTEIEVEQHTRINLDNALWRSTYLKQCDERFQ